MSQCWRKKLQQRKEEGENKPLMLDQNQRYQHDLMVFNKYTGQHRNISYIQIDIVVCTWVLPYIRVSPSSVFERAKKQ